MNTRRSNVVRNDPRQNSFRQVYRQRLDELLRKGATNLNWGALQGFCPHLTGDKSQTLKTALEEALGSGNPINIAVPATRVKNTVIVINLLGKQAGPRRLCLSHAARRSELSNASKNTPVFFVNEALRYAEDTWGSWLITPDLWTAVLQIDLINPDHKTGNDEPKVFRTVLAPVFREWMTIVSDPRNDTPEPLEAALVKDAIVLASRVETLEMLVGYPLIRLRYCFLCGGGIQPTQCLGCKRTFKWTAGPTGEVSLPPSIANCVRETTGHRFIGDPEPTKREPQAQDPWFSSAYGGRRLGYGNRGGYDW